MSEMGFALSDLATGIASTITLKEPLRDFPDAARPGELLDALPAAIYLTGDIGTEGVGSSPAELDAATREQFALYRRTVRDNPALLSGQ
jgi:hypothetical protein